ncbi:serine carboxypeptidase [Gautieria morchelliformis]|nr:serine carboxypeptidase [Gautieria morchelliformis]
MLVLACVFLAARLLQVAATQHPFFASYGSKGAAYDAGLISPIEDLGALSADEYTNVVHPAYPHHSIRIKQTTGAFCDDTVRSYTGYLSFQARHLFFYFFESRNDPRTDDVILWTNGGPGCSSSLGLFMELGPCQIKDANGTSFNPYSWNSNANIFFIDQPIGVGWSYAEYGQAVGTTEDAAKDIAAFARIFFDTFSEFKGRPFHLAGESYGGRYLPVFASQIYDENKQAVGAGLTPVNLVSVMIGNGLTDFPRTMLSYYDMQCTGASVPAFQDISVCVRMKQALPRCQRMMQDSCVDIFDAMSCGAAQQFCYSEIATPYWLSGRNPYDVSKDCEGELMETLCYPVTVHIINYMNLPATRQILGVDPSVGNFTSCSPEVGDAFERNLDDVSHQTQFYVAELLERGIRVLIYVGTYDWICNWVGNERFTLAMEWSGQSRFASQELREWKVDGKPAGLTRTEEGLTFATIAGAGHMVPYDKPAEALELVKRWLAKEEL